MHEYDKILKFTCRVSGISSGGWFSYNRLLCWRNGFLRRSFSRCSTNKKCLEHVSDQGDRSRRCSVCIFRLCLRVKEPPSFAGAKLSSVMNVSSLFFSVVK